MRQLRIARRFWTSPTPAQCHARAEDDAHQPVGWIGRRPDAVVLPQGWPGPLIGVRNMGGLVGIAANLCCSMAGRVTAPRTAIYGLNGEFEVRINGIKPDIEVEYDPKSVAAGHDPQLDRLCNT